ncbi:MAG: SDR family oxidoreductase [Clostridia bacterium]|nr:SDR family oxidoreductase [Clostridia bacterium]
MDFGLKGKHILVTGSSDGFGKALARVLSAEGARLTLHDLAMNEDKLKQLCAQLPQCDYECADLSSPDEAAALFHRVDGRLPVDMLVNNAAVWPTSYVREMTSGSFEKTLYINLVAPFVLCREFTNALRARGAKGKLVNMVSQAAFHGSTSGHAHYAASKAGLVGFSISLAREVAPEGINVNCVAPGMMRTPMNRKALEEREEEYLRRIPLGRIADPEEVAYAVAFLLGNKSDYITGATLDLTGGMLMR